MPSQSFTACSNFNVLIWPEDRSKFGCPEEKHLHKNICETGEITSYRGEPEIVARSLSQIQEE
jgi:hypothetical protein